MGNALPENLLGFPNEIKTNYHKVYFYSSVTQGRTRWLSGSHSSPAVAAYLDKCAGVNRRPAGQAGRMATGNPLQLIAADARCRRRSLSLDVGKTELGCNCREMSTTHFSSVLRDRHGEWYAYCLRYVPQEAPIECPFALQRHHLIPQQFVRQLLPDFPFLATVPAHQECHRCYPQPISGDMTNALEWRLGVSLPDEY